MIALIDAEQHMGIGRERGVPDADRRPERKLNACGACEIEGRAVVTTEIPPWLATSG